MTVSITLTFRWAMGHRILGLVGPGSKCRNVHGHNWEADVRLPNDDGALEFGAVKADIGEWIDAYWDHGFICGQGDPFRKYLTAERLKVYTLEDQPTTEAIATELGRIVGGMVGVVPIAVHVREGYRNAATWVPDR